MHHTTTTKLRTNHPHPLLELLSVLCYLIVNLGRLHADITRIHTMDTDFHNMKQYYIHVFMAVFIDKHMMALLPLLNVFSLQVALKLLFNSV